MEDVLLIKAIPQIPTPDPCSIVKLGAEIPGRGKEW